MTNLNLIAENLKLKKELEQMNNPTTFVADVAPVVHGKWIPVEAYGIGNTAKCSKCEKRQYGYDGFKFCPNCGAKMLEG